MAASLTPGARIWPGLGLCALLFLFIAPALDGPVRDWTLYNIYKGPLYWWGRIAHFAGLGMVQYGFMALLALAAWRSWRRALARTILICAASLAATKLLTQAVKFLVGRPRPRLGMAPDFIMGPVWLLDFTSFPSGHTSGSLALACIMAAHYPKQAWVFYSLAALVAVGRVLSGDHFVSDVAGGALMGLIVGLPMSLLVHRNREPGV